jgi:hypothetical protein
MSTYVVHIQKILSSSVKVGADNESAAIDSAFEADDMPPAQICAQCGGWGSSWFVDEGEWDLAEGDDAVEQLDDPETPPAVTP